MIFLANLPLIRNNFTLSNYHSNNFFNIKLISGGIKSSNCLEDSQSFFGEIPVTSIILSFSTKFNFIYSLFYYFLFCLFHLLISYLFSVGRVLQSLVIGLLVGFSFWNMGVSSSDLNMRILAIFEILVLGNYTFINYNTFIMITIFIILKKNFRNFVDCSCHATIFIHERIIQKRLCIKILFIFSIYCQHIFS